MLAILYILMVSNGIYYFEPVVTFDSPLYCEEVRADLEYYYPEYVFECVEYRDA